jgi:hypothetical protein
MNHPDHNQGEDMRANRTPAHFLPTPRAARGLLLHLTTAVIALTVLTANSASAMVAPDTEGRLAGTAPVPLPVTDSTTVSTSAILALLMATIVVAVVTTLVTTAVHNRSRHALHA